MSLVGRLRIAILAHSTNPRGGVVHAMALAEALCGLGHDAVLHAPAGEDQDFFRKAGCEISMVRARPTGRALRELVPTRIGDYTAHFEPPAQRRFDVYHAHDGLSGNAMATLKQRGLIAGFARTVHHLDHFDDPEIEALQLRSVRAASAHLVVSRLWRDALARDLGIAATLVGNGVDRTMFDDRMDGREIALREKLRLGSGPIFLSVGGVEARKNSLRVLHAFAQVRVIHPMAQLVIAGGASLLDHDAYQAAFREALNDDPGTARSVTLAGPQAQADMPGLYRLADALVFPSVKEGFGLVALEAIACGTPVVTSHIAPFTEHFGDDDVVWCNPFDVGSIANAMAAALTPAARQRLARRRDATLAPHRWERCAAAHLPVYASLREHAHA